MNSSSIGGAKVFNDLYAGFDDGSESSSGPKAQQDEASATKRKVVDDGDVEGEGVNAGDLGNGAKMPKMSEAADAGDAGLASNERKIYVGSLTPSITEKPLKEYFSNFGDIIECKVIRDRETGISRGFGFVTFACESMAETAISTSPHMLEGRQIRVSSVQNGPGGQRKSGREGMGAQRTLEELILPEQNRIYVGPLDEDILGSDLIQQFSDFGIVQGVSRLKSSETLSKRSYGFLQFKDNISVRRAFGSKVFVKGKYVKVVLSKFAMEVILNPSTVFFFDAQLHCDEQSLIGHFSQFGQVFRCIHLCDANGVNKSYGFVDFVSVESAQRAVSQRTQLIPPGQYVKVSKLLPQVHLYDLFAIGDKEGSEIIRRLDRKVPRDGTWGDTPKATLSERGLVIISKVRIPARLLPKLIGERGKTITEISRDSKTRITIPQNDDKGDNVILSVSGTKENIRTAQYLMQKILKS